MLASVDALVSALYMATRLISSTVKSMIDIGKPLSSAPDSLRKSQSALKNGYFSAVIVSVLFIFCQTSISLAFDFAADFCAASCFFPAASSSRIRGLSGSAAFEVALSADFAAVLPFVCGFSFASATGGALALAVAGALASATGGAFAAVLAGGFAALPGESLSAAALSGFDAHAETPCLSSAM